MTPQHKQAYIDPIRTVMLVDEQFLNVAEMATLLQPPAAPPKSSELTAEAELWAACRKRGWACDIEKGPYDADAVARIERCDLIVLDYHLDETGDPTPSLNILTRLAGSPGSNLVIVYTRDPQLRDVKVRVAATLRGVFGKFSESIVEILDELEPRDFIVDANVDQFLSSDSSYQVEIGKKLKQLRPTISEHMHKDLIQGLLERYLEERYRAPTGGTRRISCSRGDAGPHWVHCGNVFVAFVGKGEMQGSEVFAELERALKDWNPPPLVVSMAYARHRIAVGGFRMDIEFLSDHPALHAGWLHRSHIRGPRELVEQVLTEITDGVLDEVAAFSQTLTPPLAPQDKGSKFSRARETARTPDSVGDLDVCLALNAFLCSERFTRAHVTTGTIFREANGREDVYWICATPACDMALRPGRQVPQDVRSTTPGKPLAERPERWIKELEGHKIRSMTVLRGLVVRDDKLEKCLKAATELEHVFFRDRVLEEQGKQSLRALEVLSKELSTEQMYATGLAVVENGRFRVFKVSGKHSERDELLVTTVEMVVVGQLRKPYAARLLQTTGQHGSRIAVDFENLR